MTATGQKRNKSAHLAQILRDRILSGEIPVGAKLAPIPQLSVEYRTSVATIDKVLGILENDGLLERINGRGVYVRRRARRRFALVFDSQAEQGVFSHKAAFMRHFIRYCLAANFEYTAFENVDTEADGKRVQKYLKANPVDVVLICSRHFARHHAAYLRDLPVIAIGLYAYKWLPCCIGHQFDMVAKAGAHLKGLGCDRIGLIAGKDDFRQWASPELISFQEEYEKLVAGDDKTFSPSMAITCPDISPRHGYEAARRLLGQYADAGRLGIISIDAILTHGVLSAVMQSGLPMWERVFVVSHANSDSPMADFSIPVITYEANVGDEVERVFALSERYFATGEVPEGNHLLSLTLNGNRPHFTTFGTASSARVENLDEHTA